MACYVERSLLPDSTIGTYLTLVVGVVSVYMRAQLLKNISVEKDPKRKRDVIKKVIAYMTLGIDVSRYVG